MCIRDSHYAGDQTKGRIYRMASKANVYQIPTFDKKKNGDIVQGLSSPNLSIRSLSQLDVYKRQNISYGFSETRRWDLGAQIRYSKMLIDENARNSPFNVFSKPDSNGTTYSGISTFGIRLRLTPFTNIPELTFQASINFPMARDQETRSFLGADRVQTDLVSTYYKAISDDTYIYLQGRYILQIANNDNSKSSHFPGINLSLIHI